MSVKHASISHSQTAVESTIDQTGSHPHQLLEVIHLATEVMPERAVVELQAGVLKFELPAAAMDEFETAPAP